MRIYLIGMMGVGKTTLGKQLAKQLVYSFIDLDKEIEKMAGISIPQIFERFGEPYFRELEQKVLFDTIYHHNIVVSTGGGTPCFHDNMGWMKANGKTVYLQASAAFIISRISTNTNKRPLIKGKSPQEIKLYIDTLLAQRTTFYEQAECTVSIPTKSLSELVKSIE